MQAIIFTKDTFPNEFGIEVITKAYWRVPKTSNDSLDIVCVLDADVIEENRDISHYKKGDLLKFKASIKGVTVIPETKTKVARIECCQWRIEK